MMRRTHNPNEVQSRPQEEDRQDWKRARMNSYQRDYRARNTERERAKKMMYYREHPEYFRARDHNRRAARREAGWFTAEQWRDLCAAYGNVCLCCGISGVVLSPDHVVPIARGGANTIDNIQPLCLPCNLHKHAKHIDYRQNVSPETV